jgi:hypothetical protein
MGALSNKILLEIPEKNCELCLHSILYLYVYVSFTFCFNKDFYII